MEVKIGSRTFVGKCAEDCFERDFGDSGRGVYKYDCKIYHYPDGTSREVRCLSPIFSVPGYGDHRTFHQYGWEPIGEDDEFERSTDSRRSDSVLRSKNRIGDIIHCNLWDYFLTATFNDEIVDGANVPLVMRKMKNWLSNQVARQGIGYLLVPEFHKKYRRVHCHALIQGDLSTSFNDVWVVKDVKKPIKGETIRRYKISEDRIKYPVFNVDNFNYGFTTAIPVYGVPARLACYVKKYITKDQTMIFGRSYWVSKNLKLYPDVELRNLAPGEFDATCARPYYSRAVGQVFKYVDNTGINIEEEVATNVTKYHLYEMAAQHENHNSPGGISP